MDRRTFVNAVLGTGAAGAAVAMGSVIVSIRPVRRTAGEAVIEEGDRLVFALGPTEGQPIARDGLALGQGVLAYPEGKADNHDNLLMVVRMDPAALVPPTRLEWTADGCVAYSAICTHLACTVRFAAEGTAQAPAVGVGVGAHIHCPCHAAMFDPARGAQVLAGPAPRPLPQLPLRLNDAGELVAAGGFSEPVGVIAA